MQNKDFDYIIIPVNLETTRLNSPVHTGLKNTLTVLEIGDINAGLSIKINKTSSAPIILRNGDFYNFDGFFEDIFFTNVAVGKGIAEIGFGKNVTLNRSLRVTADIIQQGLRQAVVTIGITPTLIPTNTLNDRINWIMKVPSTGQTVYIGASDVSDAGVLQGFPVEPGQSMPMGISQNVDVYGIVAAGTQDVNLLEGT